MSESNYPDNIHDFDYHPSSPFYKGTRLDCGHLDIDDCECEDLQEDSQEDLIDDDYTISLEEKQ